MTKRQTMTDAEIKTAFQSGLTLFATRAGGRMATARRRLPYESGFKFLIVRFASNGAETGGYETDNIDRAVRIMRNLSHNWEPLRIPTDDMQSFLNSFTTDELVNLRKRTNATIAAKLHKEEDQ